MILNLIFFSISISILIGIPYKERIRKIESRVQLKLNCLLQPPDKGFKFILSKVTMLPELNEYCWINILKHVGFKDKLALATIFETVNKIVKYQWSHLKDVTLNRNFLAHFEEQPGQLDDFLACASKSLQNMVLTGPVFDRLLLYSFPNMRGLDWNNFVQPEKSADEQVLLLTQLFPNLTRLTMCSRATGMYLTRWSELQELHMTRCEFKDTSTIPDIFGTLPLRKVSIINYCLDVTLEGNLIVISTCPTLEELVIDDYVLADFPILSILMQLPRFRCLAFKAHEEFENVFWELASFPLRVEMLIFRNYRSLRYIPMDFILHMKNLRRVKLIRFFNEYEYDKYICIFAKLLKLEELHLINMDVDLSHTQLLQIVEKSSFNLLNLSGCSIDNVSVLNRVLEKRCSSSPLTLNLHEVKLSNNSQKVIEELQKLTNLKISFEPIELKDRDDRFTDVHFYPNHI